MAALFTVGDFFMDVRTIRRRHAASSHNRNAILATIEENVSEDNSEALLAISNALADIEGSATPQELCRILRRNGCEKPYKLLYHSLFYTVSTLLARSLENKLE